MAPAHRNGKGTTGKSKPSLSEQTHQEILDIFKVAAENSGHPAIRDAAIDLIRGKSEFQHKQDARLSPNLALFVAVGILISAGVASWIFFVHYSDHVASILTFVAVSLAIIGVGLVAMFSRHLSASDFLSILRMVWSKIASVFMQSGSVEKLSAEEEDSTRQKGD
jgi:hypothetical protein